MRKRLLAVLLACCVAVNMAGAAFAAEDLPPAPDPPAVTEAAQEQQEQPPAPDPTAEPAADPPVEATAEPPVETPPPEAEPAAEPTATPSPEATAEPTPDVMPSPAPTETPAPTEMPEPTETPEPTATPIPTPAATVVPASTVQTPETAAEIKMDLLRQGQALDTEPAVVEELTLKEDIATDGCFTAIVNGNTGAVANIQYTWSRSKDNKTWEVIEPQRCSGDDWNIDPRTPNKLNAALDAFAAHVGESERLYYKVEAVGTDARARTASGQVPYYIQLQNGSFETPSVADAEENLFCHTTRWGSAHFLQVPHGGDVVWRTTAYSQQSDNGPVDFYIEIADGTNREYGEITNNPYGSYHVNSAYDKDQFAELNCEAYGALYQDVLTAPGTTLHWSLAHNARKKSDTMALLIAPVKVADEIVTKLKDASGSSAAIQTVLNGSVEVEGAFYPVKNYLIKTITDKNGNWQVYNGDYKVPPEQYLSRFFFVAVSCGSGTITEGNLLDKVWFSTEVVPPTEGHAHLTVRKTLAGDLTADQLTTLRKGLTFTVTRSDGEKWTITGDKLQPDPEDPTKSSYTLQDLPIETPSGAKYTYTVAENRPETPAELLFENTQTSLNEDDWKDATADPKIADITLQENHITYADFKNTYTPQTGGLRLQKAVEDTAPDTMKEQAAQVTNAFTVGTLPIGSYTLRYDNGDTDIQTTTPEQNYLTIQLAGLTGVTITGLPAGSVTVTETDAPDLADYYCTTSGQTATVRITPREDTPCLITNSYAPFRSITLTKQVTGGAGDTRRDFAFTATVGGNPITAASQNVTLAGGARLTETGFTLPHRGSITITHLRPGQAYSIQEETYADYETSFVQSNVTTKENAIRGTVGEADAQLQCINHKDGAPPTGLTGTPATAWLWLLAEAAAFALLRRRKAV